MQITVKIKLLPTEEQEALIKAVTIEYVNLANQVAYDMISSNTAAGYSSKNTVADLPSALKNQAIRDAKSVYRKHKKTGKQSILKKPVAIWNNQNFKVANNNVIFPVWQHGKSSRIEVKAIITEYQRDLLVNKHGALRISRKSNKWIAQIAVSTPESVSAGDGIMGVDLGLKVPAVAATSDGKTKFFGNGRQNKYIKRKHRSLRRKLGKLKKFNAIKRRHNKEQRWMQDQDHKISRQIINFAKENNIGTIRLEKLSGIRQTARTSRKNEKNLHTWSFYRLAQFIEYKAYLEGIKIEYVNPKYTSQTCPFCGERNKANDRKYTCSCGFKTHRDRLGALNIISAPVVDGNSLPA